MIWKDETSYSQNDKTRISCVWETQAGGVRIVICNAHRHYPDMWHFSYYGIMNHAHSVPFTNIPKEALEKAKVSACAHLRIKLHVVLRGLDE